MIIRDLYKEEFLSFLKIFIFCFVVVFLVINFGTIKRIYNYKVVYGGAAIAQLQNELPIQSKIISTEKSDSAVVAVAQLQNGPVVQEKIVLAEKSNSIEIPKIKITAPLVLIESAEKSIFSAALNRGVVHYPDSSLPGEKGQIIFLGHSAPVGWPKIKYDWVFSELGDLVLGDKIYLYFNQQKYTYTVKEKVVLDKGGELPASAADALVLITCWPPGADRRRMAVIAY